MSVNKVILVGRLGADPESRSFPNGGSVCNLSVATTESWRDKQTGERQERTEWHRIVLRNKLGEIAQQYLRKGSQVYIEGRIQTRKWQDQEGKDQYATEIVANEMTMLDSKGAGNGDAGQASTPAKAAADKPAKAGKADAAAPAASSADANENDSFDDDIPF